MPAACAVETLPPIERSCVADGGTTLRNAVLITLGDIASVGDGRHCVLCPGFRADAETIGNDKRLENAENAENRPKSYACSASPACSAFFSGSERSTRPSGAVNAAIRVDASRDGS